jgi:hypothetical protein
MAEIRKMLWPPNSSVLNTIEPTWFCINRQTIKRGLISSRPKLTKEWVKC